MGVDCTFHPVKPEEIDQFVFSVFDESTLVKERVKSLTQVPEDSRYLVETLYPAIVDYDPDDDFSAKFGFAAAGILSYLHPYYYSRNFTLFDLSIIDDRFSPLLSGIQHHRGDFPHHVVPESPNYCLGYYVTPESILPFLNLLKSEDVQKKLNEQVDEDNLSSLFAVLYYCQKGGLGFYEANEIVTPFSGEFYGCSHNLRAPYLDNMDDDSTAREGKFSCFHLRVHNLPESAINSEDFLTNIKQWIYEEPLLPPLINIFESDIKPQSPPPKKRSGGEVFIDYAGAYNEPTTLEIYTVSPYLVLKPEQWTETIKEKLHSQLLGLVGVDAIEMIWDDSSGSDANDNINANTNNAVDIPSQEMQLNALPPTGFEPKHLLHGFSACFDCDGDQVLLKLNALGKREIWVNGEQCISTHSFNTNSKDSFLVNGNEYEVAIRSVNVMEAASMIVISKNKQPCYMFATKLRRMDMPTKLALKYKLLYLLPFIALFASMFVVRLPGPALFIAALLGMLLTSLADKRYFLDIEPIYPDES
ncbi:hypothetical protein MHO82_11115 [Vibrio sp. Of7-15]|uniref:hypothetical protein n=1 Tax=Vibrio sp. Of7-15 TaxID=2724879 RepID=UPI001EF320DF|nr:hypothetical protein [Vibrio sp. Of7-15]MCG7497416.1 hypothetical protein [Vibrio sp. Of7-15]